MSFTQFVQNYWEGFEPQATIGRTRKQIVNIRGEDVSEGFHLGAHAALDIMRKENIHRALLKENSPSCELDQFMMEALQEKNKGQGNLY